MLLSLDLSLNETGYCIDTNKSTESGIIKPDSKLDQYQKIEFNLTRILELIKLHGAGLVAIESAAYGMKSSSTNILAEQQGICKYELKKRGIGVIEVPITTIKKFITGKGNSKKVDVIKALRDKYNVLSTNHNECDAIALHLYLKAQDHVLIL